MTYKLEPSLEKIVSPVILVFPDGSRKEYPDGVSVRNQIFGVKYLIDSVRAAGNAVEVVLKEAPPLDGDSSFF